MKCTIIIFFFFFFLNEGHLQDNRTSGVLLFCGSTGSGLGEEGNGDSGDSLGSEVTGRSKGSLTEFVNSVSEERDDGHEENKECKVAGEVDDVGPPAGSASDIKFERLKVGESRAMDSTVVQELELRQDVFRLEVLEGELTPAPLEVKDVGIESDGQIGGDKMVFEMGTATGREIEFVVALDEVDFGRGAVSTIDGSGLGDGGVGEEPIVQ